MILNVSVALDKDDIETMMNLTAKELENLSDEFNYIYDACVKLNELRENTFMRPACPFKIENLDLDAAQELKKVLS